MSFLEVKTASPFFVCQESLHPSGWELNIENKFLSKIIYCTMKKETISSTSSVFYVSTICMKQLLILCDLTWTTWLLDNQCQEPDSYSWPVFLKESVTITQITCSLWKEISECVIQPLYKKWDLSIVCSP